MPRGVPRLTDEEVRTRIERYGYFFVGQPDYKNQNTPMTLYDAQLGKKVKLSLRDIKYRVRTGKRSEYDIYNVLNTDLNQQPQPQPVPQANQSQNPGFIRFVNKLRNYSKFNTLTNDQIDTAFNKYKLLCQKLSRKRNFDIDFNNPQFNNDLMLFVFIEALQASKRKMNKRIKIKVEDHDGYVHYYELSYETIDYFQGLLEDKKIF